MAELATIARPYAEAMFVASHSSLAATQGWLDDLAAVAGNVELLQFAANPKVTAEQVYQLIAETQEKAMPKRIANFLRTVIENDRLAILPDVARQFRIMVDDEAGSAEALIQSAFPIKKGELGELMKGLEKRFARKLKPNVQVDESLIGGIRVTVGDQVLDTSVKAQLEQMKAALSA